MDRRNVLKAGAVPAAALSLSPPALAQTRPKVSWRLTSSFPRNLETLYGAAILFSRMVGEATDGDFSIPVFAPGEIVPALEAREGDLHGFGRVLPDRGVLLLHRHRPGLHVQRRASVRYEQPAADGVVVRD